MSESCEFLNEDEIERINFQYFDGSLDIFAMLEYLSERVDESGFIEEIAHIVELERGTKQFKFIFTVQYDACNNVSLSLIDYGMEG